MDPWKASTVAKWLKMSERKYDVLRGEAITRGICLKPKCNYIRDNPQDLLCPFCRAEYNDWSSQFFNSNKSEVSK